MRCSLSSSGVPKPVAVFLLLRGQPPTDKRWSVELQLLWMTTLPYELPMSDWVGVNVVVVVGVTVVVHGVVDHDAVLRSADCVVFAIVTNIEADCAIVFDADDMALMSGDPGDPEVATTGWSAQIVLPGRQGDSSSAPTICEIRGSMKVAP